MGVHIGIYSSMYEWASTVGDYTGFSAYPLWYAHYDDIPSFSDGMYKFGGKSKAHTHTPPLHVRFCVH